ncbi:MAG: hypothetical protein COC08_00995 [Maribacter sp.]|nr:MAG: hypothetical protein COC08_00995 [Maribacter sp.]
MEDELIKIWQSSAKVEQVKFEKSRLMLDMQSSLDRFHQLVKYGILSEQIAVLIIIPVFLFYTYLVPPVLSKIASFLIIIWAIWYMIQLRTIKKKNPKSITLNYLHYLKENQTYLSLLKNMTNTALYWYVLPPMTGYFLFITGFYFEGIIDSKIFLIVTFIGLASVIATYFYSQWIVKKIYSPRLKKIDELIRVLEE